MAACQVCGRAIDACQLANTKVPDHLAHQFQPGPSRLQLVAPSHELHQSPHQAQRRRWRDLVAEHARPAHPTLMDGDQQ